MSILRSIKNDQIAARKARDTVLAPTLTTLISEIEVIGKNDGNRESTDVESVSVLKKFISNAQENIRELGEKNILTPDVHNTLMGEINLYTKYLPTQIEENALFDIIKDLIANGVDNIGAIMGSLSKSHGGLYDGRMASTIAKDLLSNKVSYKKI